VRVHEFAVQGFKSFMSNELLELAPLTLLYGKNSSGKSSLMGAIAVALQTLGGWEQAAGLLVHQGSLRNMDRIRSALVDGNLAPELEFRIRFESNPSVPEIFLNSTWNRLLRRMEPRVIHLETTPELSFLYRPPTKRSDPFSAFLSLQDSSAWHAFTAPQSLEVIDDMAPQFALGVGFPGSVSGWVSSGVEVSGAAFADRTRTWDRQAREWARTLKRVLDDTIYIGPWRPIETGVRDIPGDSIPRWVDVTNTLTLDPGMSTAINGWLDRLGIGYQVDLLRLHADAPMDSSVVRLVLRDKIGRRLDSAEVGTGISQVLPIVSACLFATNQLVLVEQPELHIHPRLQAELADLLVASVTNRGNQLLVESHSEHILLRIRRRIRSGEIDPAVVRVLYIDQDAFGTSHVLEINVDESGEFTADWPSGFFDERYSELFDP
jgi:hypothetical protein